MFDLKHRIHLGIIASLVAISTTSFAHDGHDHGDQLPGSHPPVPNFSTSTIQSERMQSVPSGIAPAQQFSNAAPLGSCTTGCCSGNNNVQVNSEILPSRYFGNSQLTTFNRSRTTELEQLATRLANSLRYEMQGHQYLSSIMADANSIVTVTQTLGQSEIRGATPDMLINEARPIVMPLQRLSQFLRSSQAGQSQQAVDQLGQSLVLWAREKQSPSMIGSPPPLPTGNVRTPISPGRVPQQQVDIPSEMKGVALLPTNEQPIALRQKTCPVTEGPLGSMGKPIRVSVGGKSIYVCCQGCVGTVQNNPEKYL
ncbi:hypothetical protein [Thalassoglobus sp.]|uniref:hypothetical protein n=1 Tax=Thalassoglobus sp. TaxID=2795869 RepID=UPI003AA9A4D3